MESTTWRSIGLIVTIVILTALATIAGLWYLSTGSLPWSIYAPQQTPTTTSNGSQNICSGVKKDANGYHFSWLHVSPEGFVEDEHNCIIHLVGFNMGALDEGNGALGVNTREPTWMNTTFHMNIARVVFNAYWYNTDVYVPVKHEHFQQVLKDYVKLLESLGDYVELDPYTNFHTPPCGNDHQGVVVTFCPPQNWGETLYKQTRTPANFEQTFMYAPSITQAWESLAEYYKNDPAILYDTMNEPTWHRSLFWTDITNVMQTIRAHNPRSLLIVFVHGWRKIQRGKIHVYDNISNLVMDFHIYDGYKGKDYRGQNCSEPGKLKWNAMGHFQKVIAYTHRRGWGLIINEWGGCVDLSKYHNSMIQSALLNHTGLVYFNASNVRVSNKVLQLNQNGVMVQAGYAQLLPQLSTAANTSPHFRLASLLLANSRYPRYS